MAGKLSKSPVWPTLAVRDLGVARKFYEDVLGYEPMMESDSAVAYKGPDGTGLTVYPSAENAGTNQATSASWTVTDIAGVMEDLEKAGVEFEEYDQPSLKTEAGVATWTENDKTVKAAWFKDPDGNILNIIEM